MKVAESYSLGVKKVISGKECVCDEKKVSCVCERERRSKLRTRRRIVRS